MTATAIGSSPHETRPLPAPSPGEVITLQAMLGYPAVSVLCSTGLAPQLSRSAGARLQRLVTEAERRLRDELGREAEPLAGELRRLAADAAGRPSPSAIALYVSSRHSSAWGLSVAVNDRVVIDPTFATRDLIRSLHRTPRHVVLVLTDREARLFDGIGDVLLAPFGGPFPIRAERPPRPGRARTSERSRRSQRGTDVAEQGDAFLRTVDAALGAYLSVHPAPLVLIGAPRTVAQFRYLSRNTSRLAGVVHGSHARTPVAHLAALIRPILDDYLHSRQAEALELLEKRTGAGRVAGGMAAVWLAARAERPEMLAVEQSLFFPARISPDGDFLTPATDIDHPDVIDDVVDEVIEIVLRRGGWVALVDDGALAQHEGIALALRRK